MDQGKVGKFLAELRRSRGLSQKELGERVGATDKTVSRWERGKNLPDIDTLLALSKIYGININELLCGEKLAENELPQRSEENIGHLIKEEKRKIRFIVTISALVIIIITLIFLSVIGITFITSRQNMLYPISISDAQTQKTYKGNKEISADASGEQLYIDNESNISFRFDLPDGYIEKGDGIYRNGTSFIKINTYNEMDYAYPQNLAISQYFAQQDISRYVDKVKFAYMTNINDVGLFDSENSIEIAAGCRIIRAFASLANTDEQIGEFYSVTGDYRGYIISALPSGEYGNVWSVCLEKNESLLFITVSDQNTGTFEKLSAFISSINFDE